MDVLSQVLLILFGSQCLFLSVFLFLTARGSRKSNIILGLLFLFLGLQVFLIYIYGWYPFGLNVYRTTFLLGAWVGPLLYLYTKSLPISKDTSTAFRDNRIAYLLPLVYWLLVPFTERNRTLEVYDALLCSSFFVYALIYLNRCVRQRPETEIDHLQPAIRWARIVLIIMLVVQALDVAELVIRFFTRSHPFDNLIFYVEIILLLVMVNYFIYFGAAKADIFMGYSERSDLLRAKPKYASIEMSSEESNSLYARIVSLMDKEELYLKQRFKITDLARLLDAPVNKVSRSINENAGQSFSELINSRRIEHAKKLLTNPENEEKLFAIAIDSGFNNKVSFYKNFKHFEGMSPSEYRNRVLTGK